MSVKVKIRLRRLREQVMPVSLITHTCNTTKLKTSSKPIKNSTSGATDPKRGPDCGGATTLFRIWTLRPNQPMLVSKATKSPWVVTGNNRDFNFFLQLLLLNGTKGLTTLTPCPHPPQTIKDPLLLTFRHIPSVPPSNQSGWSARFRLFEKNRRGNEL
jgi:hypothetical protein